MARIVVADRDARIAAVAAENEALLADEGEDVACAASQTRPPRLQPAKTQTDWWVLEGEPAPFPAPAPAVGF